MYKAQTTYRAGVDVDVIVAPDHWAAALVNDDFSGLDDKSVQEIEAFKRRIAPAYVVATENGDPWFTWHYQLYVTDSEFQGGSVRGYIVHTVR